MNTLGHDQLLSSDDLTIEVSSTEMVEEETSCIESEKVFNIKYFIFKDDFINLYLLGLQIKCNR
jgi:hypothetical protein